MTLPNASTLDPATVRVMCAEEMGWKWYRFTDGELQWCTLVEPDATWPTKPLFKGVLVDKPDTAERDVSAIIPFEESADAALALVGKLESEGWDISIDFIGKGRRCAIWNDSTDHEASADHPAMATALCFLKARGRAL